MVDSVSAETRIKELLEESRNCTYPEDATGIKQRYKDTALILFRVSFICIDIQLITIVLVLKNLLQVIRCASLKAPSSTYFQK